MSLVPWTPTGDVGEGWDEGGIVVLVTLVAVVIASYWIGTCGTKEKIKQIKLPSGLTVTIYGVGSRPHRS